MEGIRSLCWSENNREWFYDLPQEILEQNEMIYKMLFRNQIPGLLPMRMQYVDSFVRIYYSAGEMTSLKNHISHNKIPSSYGLDILWKIIRTLQEGEAYFLEPTHYSFSPENIYIEPHRGNIFLCYFAEEAVRDEEGILYLLEFLMEHIDHKERGEIEILYNIYENVSSHGFVLGEIEQCLKGQKDDQNDGRENERLETLKNSEKTSQEKDKDNKQKINQDSSLEKKPKILRLCKIKNKEIRKIQNRYRFLPPVINLTKDKYVFGRGSHCDVSMPLTQVSNTQFILRLGRKGTMTIVDEDSSNGTYLNGTKLKPYSKAEVNQGDIISFGEIQYRIC